MTAASDGRAAMRRMLDDMAPDDRARMFERMAVVLVRTECLDDDREAA